MLKIDLLFQVFRASTVLGIPLHLLSRDQLAHFIDGISRYKSYCKSITVYDLEQINVVFVIIIVIISGMYK